MAIDQRLHPTSVDFECCRGDLSSRGFGFGCDASVDGERSVFEMRELSLHHCASDIF